MNEEEEEERNLMKQKDACGAGRLEAQRGIMLPQTSSWYDGKMEKGRLWMLCRIAYRYDI
jgi:hypothetical protein